MPINPQSHRIKIPSPIIAIGGVLNPPANPPIGGTGINVGSGVGQAALVSFLALACAVVVDELIRPKPRVIVELGAGDYKNAIAMKAGNPSATVIATNLASEWDLGRKLVKGGIKPDPSSTAFFVDMYKGWSEAKVAGVIVGDTRPIETQEVPPGIADFVYTIFPYPDTADLFGIAAANIAKNAPGTMVSITSGGSAALPRFIDGFRALRPFAQFSPMEGAPFGLPYNFLGRTWEGGNLITAIYLHTSIFP